MNYEETLHFLYNSLPAYERQGNSGYKPGLDTSLLLDEITGHPTRRYRCIHIAGTNGKGSVANLLAATLTSAGYKTGLYTSPHIFDFTERIRIDGSPITREEVVTFVENLLPKIDNRCEPSFFEFTTAMAFDHFARHDVDFAVVETGLGGRLDSTNIITPVLSVITNISLDHTTLLGDTPALIAREKAGIIKPGVPVVIGEDMGDEVNDVFRAVADERHAPLITALPPLDTRLGDDGLLIVTTARHTAVHCALTANYQPRNIATALTAIDVLNDSGITDIDDDIIDDAFANVASLTGFFGRWTVIDRRPLTIVDPGHNTAAWQYITRQLTDLRDKGLTRQHLVIGFAADKDIDAILDLIPRDAVCHFTQADSPRALPAEQLQQRARNHNLYGTAHPTLNEALDEARHHNPHLILIAGSFYLLASLPH